MEFAGYDEDALETLVDLLVKVRAELIGAIPRSSKRSSRSMASMNRTRMRPTMNAPRPRRPPRSTP